MSSLPCPSWQVGFWAGFGWATELSEENSAHTELAQVIEMSADPRRAPWLYRPPREGSRLAQTLGDYGVDSLEVGDDFSEGFINGAIAAWEADDEDVSPSEAADNERSVSPVLRPDGEPLRWDDVDTWFCMDCDQDADAYRHLDGYIRCLDCAAVWEERHLDIEEWR